MNHEMHGDGGRSMSELSAVQTAEPTPSKPARAAKIVLKTVVTFAWFVGSLFIAAGIL